MNYDIYLMHWGIKGQRWGVRRYQNSDGSLTPDGRARYGKGEGSGSKAKTAAKIAGGVAAAGAVGAVGYAAYKKNSRIDKSDGFNSNRAKEIAKRAIDPSIKGGKDKPNVSPAQKIGSSASDIAKVATKAHNLKKYGRPAKQMSDEELRTRINRLDLEKRYEQLAEEDVERGRISVSDIFSVIGNTVTIGTMIWLIAKNK